MTKRETERVELIQKEKQHPATKKLLHILGEMVSQIPISPTKTKVFMFGDLLSLLTKNPTLLAIYPRLRGIVHEKTFGTKLLKEILDLKEKEEITDTEFAIFIQRLHLCHGMFMKLAKHPLYCC
jgi:hypothetical protein